MKALRKIVSNIDELEEAERLNFKKHPEPKWKCMDYYFDIDGLQEAFIEPESGDILATVFGDAVRLKFDDDVYKKITSYLEYK